MDRLRVWIESRNSISTDPSYDGSTNSSAGPYIVNCIRPPPLRTSRTYDDDDAFNNVSLHLISRFQTLGLSTSEAIVATLVSPKSRASYYDGLCIRLDRASYLHPSMASIVRNVDKVFGRDLRHIVEQDHCDSIGANNGIHIHYRKPIAPRNAFAPIVGQQLQQQNIQDQQQQNQSMSLSSSSLYSQQRKKKGRKFFPDSTSSIDSSKSGNGASSSSSSSSSTAFFRKNKVQNIDWKLAQAIERVESLRLDCADDSSSNNTTSAAPNCTNSNYNNNNWRSGSYQAPSLSSHPSHYQHNYR